MKVCLMTAMDREVLVCYDLTLHIAVSVCCLHLHDHFLLIICSLPWYAPREIADRGDTSPKKIGRDVQQSNKKAGASLNTEMGILLPWEK